MFGFFKKKAPPTVLDGVIRSIYGDNPTQPRSADLSEAIRLADQMLLGRAIDLPEIRAVAKGLFAGPIPYSTCDLAISVALHFYRNENVRPRLRDAQMAARLQALEWLNEGKLAKQIALAFEESLYNRFKPTPETISIERMKQDYDLYKKKKIKAENHEITEQIVAFHAWQHNGDQLKQLETDQIKETLFAEDIERAFLLGALHAAFDVYEEKTENDAELVTASVLKTIFTFDSLDTADDVHEYLMLMKDNAAEYKDAEELGGVLFLAFTLYGRAEDLRYRLSELVRDQKTGVIFGSK